MSVNTSTLFHPSSRKRKVGIWKRPINVCISEATNNYISKDKVVAHAQHLLPMISVEKCKTRHSHTIRTNDLLCGLNTAERGDSKREQEIRLLERGKIKANNPLQQRWNKITTEQVNVSRIFRTTKENTHHNSNTGLEQLTQESSGMFPFITPTTRELILRRSKLDEYITRNNIRAVSQKVKYIW